MFETSPSYIRQLLRPNGAKNKARRVWSIDLETVWLPLFHATNIMGDTAMPAEALGSPIRLAYDKDGAVKFTKSGRPVTRVVKDITQTVTLIRENMVANLQSYTNEVIEGKAEAYKASVTQALKAGKPILDRDRVELDKAIKLQIEQALIEAERQEAEQEAEPVAEPVAESKTKNGNKVKVGVTS